MKKFILLASVAFLASCIGPLEKKQYDFEIIYANGDTSEVSFVGLGTNLFSLKNGDLTTKSFTKTLVSGVRSYRVLNIKSLGLETEAEADKRGNMCGCDLRQVTNQE